MSHPNKNLRLAVSMFAVAAGMLMLAYASVPLYRLFCAVTGFGGTTQTATALPTSIGERVITIRFNADINESLPWEFKPSETQMKVHVGEQKLTHYTAHNLVDYPTHGNSTYNVTPHKAGPYFNKIQCFCFQEQTLTGGQKVTMPVSFFVDPAIEEDPDLKDVDTITLSYTFFPVKPSQ